MRRGLLILLLLSAAAGADAAPACYRANEVEADQAVQFQTELMVVSNACKVPIYTKFTQRNRSTIVDYQHELIEHFRRAGERHAETVFETYLTHLANESALRAGEQPPEALCAQSAGWLSAADVTGPEEFRRLAASRAAVRSPAYPRCGG
jgi:hypothetical protein